jgi:membrane fusion protein (multidrug efflux system)
MQRTRNVMATVSPIREDKGLPLAETGAQVVKPPRRRAPFVFGGLLIAAGTVAAVLYATRLGKESTDDAQVEAHAASVAARVSGQVTKVLVVDNEQVKVGQVLVQLDDRDQQVRLRNAKAVLGEANAQLELAQTQLALTMKTAKANLTVAEGAISQAAALTGSTAAQIDQAKADVTAAEARKTLTKLDLDRAAKLKSTGATTQAEIDMRQSADTQADASLHEAQARLASALANRSNSSGTEVSARGRLLAAQTVDEQIKAAQAQVELAQARVDENQAAVDRAALELEYTKVKAEMAGSVTKRNVEPGQLVSPDRALMAIVDLSDTWVVANLKETQLSEIKPGQKVDIEIDTFDGHLTGHVDSVAAGTGSRFSLLPPENATGNFIKVTQRVPVKVIVDDRNGHTLRPGMSAEVVVHTR